MPRFVVIDKKVGETPLAALHAWEKQHPQEASLPASYAGRLDPMASGKLLVLLGEECKRQQEYTGLDKEYEIEVLLDIGSDTGDVLGIPKDVDKKSVVDPRALATILRREQGVHTRAYPAFSSKTVAGKPLFLYALTNSLATIEMPVHRENIFRIALLDQRTLSVSELKKTVYALLDTVPRTTEPSKRLGEDFRVDTIRTHWTTLFARASHRSFTVLTLRVTCGSGTYMRSLAGRIGTALDTHALALSIKRTKIGRFRPIWRGRGLWLTSY